jgi:monoterpene epsilon-lactone hydrolase
VADIKGNLHVGPRTLPLPANISPEAKRAIIEAWSHPYPSFPDGSASRETWRQFIADMDVAFAPLTKKMLEDAPATVEKQILAGVTVYRGVADAIPAARAGKVVLEIHGGAFVMFPDGHYAEALAATYAGWCECVVYSVNYRTPPDFPFPAPLDDVVAVYREMLKTHRPADVAFAGQSAGGTLAAAAVLKIRDLGLPLPGMVLLDTPATDLTLGGDSLVANMGLDSALRSHASAATDLYVDGHDPRDPYVSPLFGNFGKGFPPTFIKTGTRDLLLSNAVLMHRALRQAGIEAELNVWEGMSHGGFVPHSAEIPEDRDALVEMQSFLDKHWGRRSGAVSGS